MVTSINLLGAPEIVRDGPAAPGPRGRKAWALLAYLLLSERPATRRQLAELLFIDAEDPLGALRWNLAQLRRALGDVAELEGDPVKLNLSPEVNVDVRGSGEAAGELLEGMEFTGSPAFESWLLVARRRYAGQAAAVLHERAVAELAAGNAEEAADIAARLVALDPFEEGFHELLVRALAAKGDRAGALAQVAACRRLFRQELGTEPSPAVNQAARTAGDGERGPADRVAAQAHLDAGTAALDAGAVEHGLSCLRQACGEADNCGDDALHARALVALGTSLVHAVRGRDEEGAVVLHEALAVAERAGDRTMIVAALRELAFTDIQAGRRASVDERLSRANRLANSDAEHASVLSMQGMNRSDMADYAAALESLEHAVEYGERADDGRRIAFALSLIGRARLLRGETDEAVRALDRALAVVESERWLAFLPFPESMRGEIDLAEGNVERAAERFERSFALGCELRDPCWEALSARNLGRLHSLRGDAEGARSWIDEARSSCSRVPDRYVWMQGHVLDTAIEVALDRDDRERAAQLIRVLGALAARTEMHELVVRGLVHAGRFGEPGALESAQMLAADIDNPALAVLVGGNS